MINITMMGVAHPHADQWARAWNAHVDVRLCGVWDQDAARAEAWGARHGVRVYQTREELLGDPAVDAVGICSENSGHAANAIAAAEAGMDILCEKPTAAALEDCDDMIRAVEKAGVRYMQAFPMRVDPVNERIKALLDAGAIGKVLTFRKRHGIGWAALGDMPEEYGWFTDESLAGGGAFLDEGVHAADFLIWMFGFPLSITAKITNCGGKQPLDDNGVAILEFPNHVIGTLHASWVFQAASVTTEIFGEEGTILQQSNDCASTAVNGEDNFPLKVYSRTSSMPGWENPRMPANFKQIHEAVATRFADCLVSGQAFPSSLQDGRDALRLILAAYQSARENRTIYFQEEAEWEKK